MFNRFHARSLLALLAGTSLMSLAVQAQTIWYVDDDAPNDPGPGNPSISDPQENGSAAHPFDAIQEGINAAQEGDTVLVLVGTYTGLGNRDLGFGGRAITVRSTDPNDPSVVAATVINCQANYATRHRGFTFSFGEGSDSLVAGFTITNGFGPEEQIGSYSYTSAGGAILCSGASPTIANCTISNNSAHLGGGIYLSNSSHATITDCTISTNHAYEGGALACYHGNPLISNCTISGNSASGAGGGIVCYASNPTISNCTINENTATIYSSGAGIQCYENSSPTVSNCVIAGNAADSSGGGISSDSSDPTISNCTITGSSASGGTPSRAWINTPDQRLFMQRFPRGFWRGKLWGFSAGRLLAFDGESFQYGGRLVPGHQNHVPFFTDAGVFVFSTTGNGQVAHISKSPDGQQDFVIKFSGARGRYALPRSLVYCGPTDTHPGGVLFFPEHAHLAARVLYSTDDGETWVELFQCAEGAIKHFHGALFAPGVGANEGRLYLMTGDADPESSVLICDDIDDLIANPETWKDRWGLDVPYERHIDPEYTINDDLDESGTPTSQDFRVVDILIASDGYIYWVSDTHYPSGQPAIRVNQLTEVVERLDSVVGYGWVALETAEGVILFATGVRANNGSPTPSDDVYVHLYALRPDTNTCVEIKKWRRDDYQWPNGNVTPTYCIAAFDHIWLQITKRPVEYGARVLVGRVKIDPQLGGGGIYCDSSAAPTATNCVVWGNTAAQGSEIALVGSSTLTVSYSDLQGGQAAVYVGNNCTLNWGPGNIDADPLFADPSNADYRLSGGSPCIDAGCNWAVPPDVTDLDNDGDTEEITPLDLDGEGRFFDDPNTPDTGCGLPPIVDIGAYELGDTGPQPCFADFNGDRVVNLSDLATLLANYGESDVCEGDLDCDGDVELADLSALLAVYGTTCP